jgi:hypothetical protein
LNARLEPESPSQRLTLRSLDDARHGQREREAGRPETFMYLAKFFHRPPADDDRELLLIPSGDPMIIGFRMRGSVEIQTEDFLREQFSEIGSPPIAVTRPSLSRRVIWKPRTPDIRGAICPVRKQSLNGKKASTT